ncbi:MAG TPA: hypothetical protein ENJ77_01605 [Candidatus Moranbacteria bacterium]|nr:hypothetical protein [Candidatus Moranbacteria bacterium]
MTVFVQNPRRKEYRLDEPKRYVFLLENISTETEFVLAHRRTEVFVFALYDLRSSDRIKLRLRQRHLASETRCEISVRAVLRAGARMDFRGGIIVPGGLEAVSSSFSHFLLLDGAAAASAVPEMSVLSSRADCRHGAVFSRPEAEQIDYLSARGLTSRSAEELLTEGFLRQGKAQIDKLLREK